MSFDPTRKNPMRPVRQVMPVLPSHAQPEDPRNLPGDAVMFQHWLTKKRMVETPTLRVLVLNVVRGLQLEAAVFTGDRTWRISDQGDRICFRLKVTKTA